MSFSDDDLSTPIEWIENFDWTSFEQLSDFSHISPFGFWPENYISLLEAHFLYGQELYPEIDLLDYRKLDLVSRFYEKHLSGRTNFDIVSAVKARPELASGIIEMCEFVRDMPARINKVTDYVCRKSREKFLQNLYSGRISAYIFSEGHPLKLIDRHLWSTNFWQNYIDQRQNLATFLDETMKANAFCVVVKNEELTSLIIDMHLRQINKIQTSNTKIDVASPYIVFMLDISSKIGLVSGRDKETGERIGKDEIERCIRSNWRAELGEASPEKISYMATLIRHPDDAKGGNHKSRKLPAADRPTLQSSGTKKLAAPKA